MDFAKHIDAPGADERLSRSSFGGDDVIDQAPAQLLLRARRIVGDLDVHRYALARVLASELGSGTAYELLAIGDADMNRAKAARVVVLAHVCADDDLDRARFGRQGSRSRAKVGDAFRRRLVATSADPTVRHFRAVQFLHGEARGIAQGARRYFDPKTQLALWRRGAAYHPLTILERWSFNKPWAGPATRDEQGRLVRELGEPGKRGWEQWTGPIPGVDAWELMLMRPAGTQAEHARAFEEAQEVIVSLGVDQSLDDDDEARCEARSVLCCTPPDIARDGRGVGRVP